MGKVRRSGFIFLIVGFIMVVCGLFKDPNSDFVNGLYWITALSALVVGNINFFIPNKLNWSINISRIILGALFVVSGLIKANDPMGFSFKLEEYFEEEALGWTLFQGWEIYLAVFISGIEILLGLAVIFGAYIKLVSYSLLGMIGFFAWLTFYTANCNDKQQIHDNFSAIVGYGDKQVNQGNLDSALSEYKIASRLGFDSVLQEKINLIEQNFNPEIFQKIGSVKGFDHKCVKECGCFGDALKGSVGRSLSPWESFFKDMVLFVFIINILLFSGSIKFTFDSDAKIILFGFVSFNILVGAWLFGWWFPVLFSAVFSFVYVYFVRFSNFKYKALGLAITSGISAFGFACYTLAFLPVKDYLPYKIGDNIVVNRMSAEQRKMAFNEELYPPVNVYMWQVKDLKTNKVFTVRSDEFMRQKMWEDSTKVLLTRAKNGFIINYRSIQIKSGYEPAITDFSVSCKMSGLSQDYLSDSAILEEIEMNYDPGYSERFYRLKDSLSSKEIKMPFYEWNDSIYSKNRYRFIEEFDSVLYPPNDPYIAVTDKLLEAPKALWIVTYDWKKADQSKLNRLLKLAEEAKLEGWEIAVIGSFSEDEISWVQNYFNDLASVYICDGTELKKIVRSNPGLIQIEKGEVINKWSSMNFPTFKQLKR